MAGIVSIGMQWCKIMLHDLAKSPCSNNREIGQHDHTLGCSSVSIGIINGIRRLPFNPREIGNAAGRNPDLLQKFQAIEA